MKGVEMAGKIGVTRHKPIKIPYTAEAVEAKIKVIEETISAIEALPPALGVRWQAGMLAYYRRVLAELEAYRGISR